MRTIEELVGQNLKAVRERKGLSQAELGRKLKPFLGKAWSRPAVSIAESGGRSFVVAELAALALALETSVLRLLGPTEDERIKLPAKGIARSQMFKVLFGPSEGVPESVLQQYIDPQAPGRVMLRAFSEDLQICLDEAKDGLTHLESFSKNFDKLVASGWAIAPRASTSTATSS